MGCSKNYIMYWGVFTLIIVPFSHSKVCTNFQKNSHSFYSICIAHKFHIENTTYFLHKRMAFLGFYFGLTILPLLSQDRRENIFTHKPWETPFVSFLAPSSRSYRGIRQSSELRKRISSKLGFFSSPVTFPHYSRKKKTATDRLPF